MIQFSKLKGDISKYLNNGLVRNVFTIGSGTALAQVISFLFSPFITRIFEPSIYGVYGLFISIVTMVAPVIGLTLPKAIVLPEEEKKAKDLFRISIFTVIIIIGLIFIILSLFGHYIFDFFNINDLENYIPLLLISWFAYGLQETLLNWLVRHNRFDVTAKTAVIYSLFTNLLFLSIGYFYPVAIILIGVFTLGRILYVLIFLKNSSFTLNKFPKLFDIKFEILKKRWIEYVDFPKYRSPQVLFDGVSNNLPVIILASLFGATTVGLYSLANRVLHAPTALIGNAVGSAFYPHISKIANSDKSTFRSLMKATGSLSIIGIFIYGIFFIFSPLLFSIVFGNSWKAAGEIARWLAFYNFFIFILRPSIQILPVIKEQSFFLKFTILNTFFKLSILFISGYLSNSIIITVASYSIAVSVAELILMIIIFIRAYRFDKINQINEDL